MFQEAPQVGGLGVTLKVIRGENYLKELKWEEQDFAAWKASLPFSLKHVLPKLYEVFTLAKDDNILLANNNKSAGDFISTWNVNKDLHKWPEFKEFVDWIESNFQGHKITEMWANVTEPDGFLKSHNHIGHKYAGTVYISAKENCGDIVMRGCCRGKIKEGDVIIFDGDISHYTMVNNSGEDRVVAAFILEEK